MAPPPSPRDRRRSANPSKRLASSSHSSKSDSPVHDTLPRPPPQAHRPPTASSATNGRSKRPGAKPDDHDDTPAEPPKDGHPNGTPHHHPNSNANGRNKRKGKEKDRSGPDTALDAVVSATDDDVTLDPADAEPEEEQGITRCVCGKSGEDGEDAGEFMVQCETCDVWQHGLCMGFEAESELPAGEYHCEQCRPDLHTELLRSLAPSSRPRHPPTNARNNAVSRTSRSHSPNHLLKPAKRRNTMNSRDAAYDESLKELMEATAIEAAVPPLTPTTATATTNGAIINGTAEDDQAQDVIMNSRKKRKRVDDDAPPVKRTRSASTASELPQAPTTREREDTPASATANKSTSMAAPPPPPPKTSRNRRGGGRKSAVKEQPQQDGGADGDDAPAAPPPSRRSNQSRNRSGGGKRSAADSTRSRTGGGGASSAPSAGTRGAHHNGYEAALLTSWGLPDHLGHLEHMFPTDVPQALDVPDGNSDRLAERGVKVKWPAKRMSVGDMNKRVRSLVEWVVREQANLLERERRRSALVSSLEEAGIDRPPDGTAAVPNSVVPAAEGTEMPLDQEKTSKVNVPILPSPGTGGSETMKMMEELMQDLLIFQEKFGPGAKSKERDRRVS